MQFFFVITQKKRRKKCRYTCEIRNYLATKKKEEKIHILYTYYLHYGYRLSFALLLLEHFANIVFFIASMTLHDYRNVSSLQRRKGGNRERVKR